MSGCADCARLKRQVQFLAEEVRALRRRAHLLGADQRHLDELQRERRRLANRQLDLDAHRAECPAANAPKPARTPRPASVDDRERCPVCRRPVNPLPSGFLRKHNDPQGYPCTNRRRAATTETRTA